MPISSYDPNLDPEDQEKALNNAQGVQTAGGSQITNGSSATVASQDQGKPTRSDKFQNLNDYLGANQGSDFGNQFVGKVNQDVNQAQSVQNSTANEFKNRANQGAVNYDQNLVQSAVAAPSSFVTNPDNVTAFTKQRDATYAGPNSFADASDLYSQAQGATQKATNVANAANTENGRFALLNQYFGTPQANEARGSNNEYTQGQKSLDNLLIQRNDQTVQGLNQARANAQASQANFNQQNSDLANYAGQQAANTAATKTNTRAAIGLNPNDSGFASTGAFHDLYSQLNNEVDQRKLDAKSNAKLVSGTPPKNYSDLSSQQASALGLNPGNVAGLQNTGPGLFQGDAVKFGAGSLYGTNPFDYVTPVSANSLNQGNVASKDEAQRLTALEQLAGIGPTIGNIGDAGKYTSGYLVNPNKGNYLEDLGQQQKAAQSAVTNLANQYKLDPAVVNGDLSKVPENIRGQAQDLYNKYFPKAKGGGILGTIKDITLGPAIAPIGGRLGLPRTSGQVSELKSQYESALKGLYEKAYQDDLAKVAAKYNLNYKNPAIPGYSPGLGDAYTSVGAGKPNNPNYKFPAVASYYG